MATASKNVMLFASAIVLASCMRLSLPTRVYLEDPDVLVYQGGLSSDANRQAFELYEKATIKPRRLRISSGGGDVNLGMDLGDWVFRNHLDVEISDRCFSSCANYVFTAGKTKFLNPDSVLLWHGGSLQKDLEDQLKETGEKGRVYLDAWRIREKAFFSTIQVDQSLLTYGQTAAHVVRPENTAGYDYSIEDMGKFGVTNIVEKDGPWKWRDKSPPSVFRVEVRTEDTLPH